MSAPTFTPVASILHSEAESLDGLAAMFRGMRGEFCRSVGASLAVQAADFRAEALRQATGQSLSSNGDA